MSKKYCKHIFGLNPLTTRHAGRFPSGWGWFVLFNPHWEYKQSKTMKTHTQIFDFGFSAPDPTQRPIVFTRSSRALAPLPHQHFALGAEDCGVIVLEIRRSAQVLGRVELMAARHSNQRSRRPPKRPSHFVHARRARETEVRVHAKQHQVLARQCRQLLFGRRGRRRCCRRFILRLGARFVVAAVVRPRPLRLSRRCWLAGCLLVAPKRVERGARVRLGVCKELVARRVQLPVDVGTPLFAYGGCIMRL
jgi:hypothetical protein